MAPKVKQQEAQNPLILRAHRLMEAFAKSDDERDFYLDRLEGFLLYIDLDKAQQDLEALEAELESNGERYCLIPKMTFYEIKKLMESFVNEKVYDIDTKEKLLDIIQSKEARENFLEFLHDHHSELDKWQQFYQERSRIRIIEWLRQNHFHFVFEEDLDLPRNIVEKLKQNLFEPKMGKDILTARKALVAKAKTYYSSEALNPRPKRGRPPKQAVKQEAEPQLTMDIYTTVSVAARPFLFSPELINAAAITFSSKFQPTELRKGALDATLSADGIHQKLESLRKISQKWMTSDKAEPLKDSKLSKFDDDEDDDDFDDIDLNGFDDDEDDEDDKPSKKSKKGTAKVVKTAAKKPVAKKAAKKGTVVSKKETPVKAKPAKKSAAPAKTKKAAPVKAASLTGPKRIRPIAPKGAAKKK